MESYLNLLRDVMENGESHSDRTGVGTRSVFGRQWRHNMQDGFPLITTKRVPLRWVFEELRWFLSGSSNEKDLRATGVDIWKEWATAEKCAEFGREEGDLGPVYGKLWRQFGEDENYNGVDQIEQLLEGIRFSPNSRRLIVTGWHPWDANRVSLPPCHTLWQVKVHQESEISLHLYARSIDIFLGLPFNIASYGLLLWLLGEIHGLKPRDLVISFGDLHLYNNHFSQAATQLARGPRPLPVLTAAADFPRATSPLNDLLSVRWEHLLLTSYDHHPKIEAEVAV